MMKKVVSFRLVTAWNKRTSELTVKKFGKCCRWLFDAIGIRGNWHKQKSALYKTNLSFLNFCRVQFTDAVESNKYPKTGIINL